MAIAVSDLQLIVDVPDGCTNETLQVFVDTANLVVSEDLVNTGLSDARQDKIAQYLAAHYFTVSQEHGGIVTDKSGNSSEQYRSIAGSVVGLNSTAFGQAAIALDTSGTLAGTASGLKAKFCVAKTPDLDRRYGLSCGRPWWAWYG